jgi:hypothetical protein
MCAFGALHRGQPPLPLLECAYIVGHVWIFRRQGFDIADFHVHFLYPGPFCARAEEPAPLSCDSCSVERIAWDQKLHALAGAQIWTDYNVLCCAVLVQHKNFNRITHVTMIKLIVANAMQAHRRFRRHHEIECGARWPAIKEWCRKAAGRNSLVADKCDANETACGMGLKLEQFANFCRC